MAAVISARPTLPQQRMKRPPPPSIATTVNGVKSSQPSSLSPSLGSKRPPPGFKQPPSATVPNGVNTITNGSASRSSVRRKEPQKPGDSSTRPSRSARNGPGEASKPATKRMPEPYFRTTSHILKKFRGKPPSFTLHLHPTHFRFDQQDGSFSYNSPMKLLLEHVRSQTIPHDMLDELTYAGIKFYDGCLIVQVEDYRSNSSVTPATTNVASNETNIAFSIHNYNQYVTPSPCAPYPQLNTSDTNEVKSKDGTAKVENDNVSVNTNDKTSSTEQSNKSSSETASKSSKSFVTVLFPTSQSIHEEVLGYASTPDSRSNTRKQSQINGRGSVSGTNQPPTPMSAVPPTPTFSSSAGKKQKMMVNVKDLAAFEGKIIAATAPPLFLEPAKSVEETQKIMRYLQDPLFQNKPPAPKTRKRTVAELAADEALAEEEQRFMLIMDERLVPTKNSGPGNTAANGENGAASFVPSFDKFKALEEIKLSIQEKTRREQEAKSMQQQIAKAKSDLQESQMQKLQQNVEERQKRQSLQEQRMDSRVRPSMIQQQQHYMSAGQIPIAHPPIAMANASLSVSQAHSSPVVRNLTPHNNNSSPLVGNMMLSHAGNSVPMTVTTSSQGAGSPPRPGSALQHSHPSVSAAMVNQRSQQASSRNGTPHMQNGTPHLQQASPGMRNVTPTPRIRHASPAGSAVAPTPVLGHNMMVSQQQQQQQLIMQQRQAFANLHTMQGSPPNSQMSPHNLQQFAAHQAHQRNQIQQQQTQEQYRQQLQSLTQQQIGNAGPNGNPHLVTNMAALQAQRQAQTKQRYQSLYNSLIAQHTARYTQQAQNQFGMNLPHQIVQRVKDQAEKQARLNLQQYQQQQQQQARMMQQQQYLQQQQQQQQQHQHQQQQQQQQAIVNGGMMGQGMNGIGGMNGM